MARVTLISVDGIPGSGKSSTAQWLAEMLDKKGKDVLFVAEDKIPHPVRFLTDLNQPLSPWDEISAEEFSRCCLRKFSRFIEQQITCDKQDELIIVADGLMFHTDTTSLHLMQPGEKQLHHHLRELLKLCHRVSFLPLLLSHHPYGSSLAITMNGRPDKWSRMQIDWKTSSPHCTQRGYTGHEGYLEFYREYEGWITKIFNTWFTKSQRGLVICNPQDNWLATRKTVWDFYSKKLLRPSIIEDLL